MPKRANTPDRTSFLNVAKSAALVEAIKKEEKCLYKLFQKQIELGHLRLPSASEEKESASVGYSTTEVEVDPTLLMHLVAKTEQLPSDENMDNISKERLKDISRSTWSIVNPGYIEHKAHFQSASKTDYAWSEAEVAKMKEEGEWEVKHHRKRDGFTEYAEAALRNTHLQRRSLDPCK